MSSRNKKASTSNDVRKKQAKVEENVVESIGRRRSLRNNAGSSAAAPSPVTCKKPTSKSKQVEKIMNNAVNEGISKNGSPRSTRNRAQQKSPQIDVSNATPKRAPPVPIEKLPVRPPRASPRGSSSNGSVDSSVRRNPSRKGNNIGPSAKEVQMSESVKDPTVRKVQMSEAVKDSTVKKITRMSGRKRPLSPGKEADLSDACNSLGQQSAKRPCPPVLLKKIPKCDLNTQENGDVKKLLTVDPKPECDVSPYTSHSTKTSMKRSLDLDSDDIVQGSQANKKIKRDIPLKLIDNSLAENLDGSATLTQLSPNKQINLPTTAAKIQPAKVSYVKEINKLVEKSPVKEKEKLLKLTEKIPNSSIKQMAELPSKSTDKSPIKQRDELPSKSTDKSPVKSKSNSMKSSNIVLANSDEMETAPSAAEIAEVTNKEDNLIRDTTLGQLFTDCSLNKSQEKELLLLLPKNYSGLSREELVEVLVKLLLETDATIKSMTSPRFNKFLRNLLGIYCTSSCAIHKKHFLCENALNWAKERKTVNLTHELELALMQLYYNTQCYKKAEHTATILYTETKKLQDKEKVVQACLCLSQIYHAMGNISKARANITTAKTEALKIYTAPDLQAELDLQSGIMQVAEEKDMETAFSYFKEAATGFTVRKKRSRALKYMLLSKLLVNRPEDGEKIVMMQTHISDIDDGVEALISVTKAAISSSLEEFKKALDKYNIELKEDLVVKDVIDKLYTKMLEKNLINIIKPYDKIQISYVATRIGLPRDDVERRLSQLILDGQVKAQLDHRDDCLYVYETETADRVYPMALDTMSQLDRTLTHLNKRVKQLLL